MERFRRTVVSFLVLACAAVAQARGGAAGPDQAVLDALNRVSVLPVTEWKTFGDTPHGEDPTLNDSAWTPLVLGAGGRGGRGAGGRGASPPPHWFRALVEIPTQVGGRSIAGERVRLTLRLRGDGRIFFNGSLVEQGEAALLDPIPISQSAVPGTKILVAVNTPMHEATGGLSGADLSFDTPSSAADPALLRGEFQYLDAFFQALPGALQQRQQLATAESAISLDALQRGDQEAFNLSLATAAAQLATLKPFLQDYTVSALGNAHIDMAWLWPWTETVQVVRDTFTTVLQLMNEYPDFKYTQSSAVDFAWMQDKYPDLFKQIQQRVKEGRWEIVGGMWVEPDLNLPDGESLVRQLLVGKEYFQQAFGVDVNIGWNPDSFGYNWQLPQIYKKSGIDYFVTQKIVWGEQQSRSPYHFPYRLFWWQAPDGSKVLTYFPHSYSNSMAPVGMMRDLGTYAAAAPPGTGDPNLMYLYGVGDHGGGPTRAMLDQAVQLQSPAAVAPKLNFSTAHDYFADLDRRIQTGLSVPTWDDELYMVYHRGVFTSQIETKKQVRANEELLQNTEKFSSLALLQGLAYPSADLLDLWKRLLFDQFHDIMPGSGIGINYQDAAENLHFVSLQGGQILNHATSAIASRIDTAGPGIPFVVFNPLSFPRTSTVELDAELSAPVKSVKATDAAGAPLLAQVVSTDAATNRTRVAVLLKNAPALGYTVVHLAPASAPPAVPTALAIHGLTLENEYLRAVIDPSSGCITSLYDKSAKVDSLAPGACGNLLQKITDIPTQQDAWEIASDGPESDLIHPDSVKLIESGPLRATVRVTNHISAASSLVEDLSVTAGVPRVDIHAVIEMHDHHILIKAAVPVSVQAAAASYEIPYGSIQRPTTRNDDREKSEFEVPALHWGDLSDATHGLSLLNDSRYGYDALGNVLRLSLLRSPTNPDPNADIGHHEFTYALYPHAGGWKTAQTVQQGYELNFPLLPVSAAGHSGAQPAQTSLVSIEPSNVILSVVKKSETGNALVFRYYEFAGKQVNATIHLPQKAQRAVETDLMEKEGAPIALAADGRSLTLPTGPYEIKTFKVWFDNMPDPAPPPNRAITFAPGPGL